jgi:hypothetical protein
MILKTILNLLRSEEDYLNYESQSETAEEQTLGGIGNSQLHSF